jgi:hypothetical protein
LWLLLLINNQLIDLLRLLHIVIVVKQVCFAGLSFSLFLEKVVGCGWWSVEDDSNSMRMSSTYCEFHQEALVLLVAADEITRMASVEITRNYPATKSVYVCRCRQAFPHSQEERYPLGGAAKSE